MKNAWETYGTARLGGGLLIARVENDGARTMVTALLTSEDDLNGNRLDSGKLFFNAAGKLAVVKKFLVPKSGSADDQVLFEMSRSLLETPDNFYMDSLAVDEDDQYKRYLFIAYHRMEIDRQVESYGEILRKPAGFKLDAVALADGYLNFCLVEPGDLQVLVNLEAENAVLAIIYKQKIRAVGSLETAPGEDISSEIAKRLAGELKMTISYHLAELFQEGITIPPSRIILSGGLARNQTLRTALTEQITTEIALPNINRDMFQPASETIDRHPVERFLIPLGLAVE